MRRLRKPICVGSMFVLLTLLLSANMGVGASFLEMPPSSAAPDCTVVKVASGTLNVLNDDRMITENGGRIEIVPCSQAADYAPLSEEEITIVQTEEVEVDEESQQRVGPSASGPTVVRILSGTLSVFDDGSMVTENGGQIEIVPVLSTQSPTEAGHEAEKAAEQSVSVEIESQSPTETCYIHTADVSFGSTQYRRVTWYCVNDEGNEAVKKIEITNTGAQPTATLNREALGVCGVLLYQWVKQGPWIIYPGATLVLNPWKELSSGWEKDGKVVEE